ncbi:hypothetical protein CP533_2630 [Ophiocordyceps camponoti-saundersi (nom. inval.)]|nr:hypothetical protein CP533_2630 [Ophiocordyceps camponoti-saundersi (nom. inval.)]
MTLAMMHSRVAIHLAWTFCLSALCLLLWPRHCHATSPPSVSLYQRQSTPSTTSTTLPPAFKPQVPETVEWVYRGHRDSPEQVKQAGGFMPRNRPSTSRAFTIDGHLRGLCNNPETAYSSTSCKFGIGVVYAARNSYHGEALGWVYRIRATPNMVNMEGTLRQYYSEREAAEFSALGGIRWNQIHSYWRVTRDYIPREEDDLEEAMIGNFNNTDYEAISDRFTLNPDYDAELYGQSRFSAGQPQLAGFPRNHESWSQEPWRALDRNRPPLDYARDFMGSIGQPDGWMPQYPLFEGEVRPEGGSDSTSSADDAPPPPLPPKKKKMGYCPRQEDSRQSPVAERPELSAAMREQVQAIDWAAVCAAAAAQLVSAYGIRRRLRRFLFPQRQTSRQGECGKLLETVEHVLPSACTIGKVKVEVEVADVADGGTYGPIDLVLEGKFVRTASSPVRLAVDPDRDKHWNTTVNLHALFGRSSIPIKSITGIELWSGRDEIWVQDLRLIGKCAGWTTITMEKFNNLNQKMRSEDKWGRIWSGSVQTKDWEARKPCNDLVHLEVEMRLADEAWAETKDAIDLVIRGESLGRSSESFRIGNDVVIADRTSRMISRWPG